MANNKGYWLNKESRLFLSRGYLKEGQTAEERIREIAEAAAKILNKHEGFADKLEDYMLRGWFSLSSPVWSNFGNDRGLPISCAGSYVEDTMESILFTASEVGMQTKLGAGTSMFLGDLRERGAPISVGGNSHGPVHFMEIFESIVNIVSQSNIRRGACAVYLPVEHPDIKEFLQCREEGNSIQHLSLGVTITDKWMQEMIDGDAEKRKIWMRIIQKRFETGYPYIFFTDTVNNNKPDVYKDKNMKINASNLCLTGDTIITIKNPKTGSVDKVDMKTFVFLWEMSELSTDGVEVKTEHGFKKITNAAKTGKSRKLVKITAPNGKVIKCTYEHKIFTKNRGWVEAQFLKTDDELLLDDNDQ